MAPNDLQTTAGRLTPCCIELSWALSLGYVKRGYMWLVSGQKRWIPWCFNISGEGFKETSPIHFCPFSGHSLDKPED